MKKLLDGLLLVLVLGIPLFLVFVLPEGDGIDPEETRPPLEIPEPRDADAPSAVPAPGEATDIGGPPGVPGAPEDTATGPPAVEIVERTTPTRLAGYSYRGGRTPLPGPVPVWSDGVDPPLADADGRFSWTIPPGRITFAEPGVEPADRLGVTLAPGSPHGLLTVHRYPEPANEPTRLHPTEALLLQPDGALPRLLIRGVADLPDGAEVAVRLFVAGYSLERAMVRVRDGAFAGELPLSARVYHSGVYDLQVAWGPNLATRPILANVEGTAWASLDSELRRDVGVFFGTPEEAAQQTREIREYYGRALDDLEGARDILLVAGAQARRKRSKLLDEPDRVERLREHPLSDAAAGLFEGRELDLDAWRVLIDETLPAQIAPYLSLESIPFPEKHPRAAHNLVMVAQQVLKYSRLESTVVYASLGLERDARDFVQNFDFDPATEREQTLMRLRNFSDAVRRFSGL